MLGLGKLLGSKSSKDADKEKSDITPKDSASPAAEGRSKQDASRQRKASKAGPKGSQDSPKSPVDKSHTDTEGVRASEVVSEAAVVSASNSDAPVKFEDLKDTTVTGEEVEAISTKNITYTTNVFTHEAQVVHSGVLRIILDLKVRRLDIWPVEDITFAVSFENSLKVTEDLGIPKRVMKAVGTGEKKHHRYYWANFTKEPKTVGVVIIENRDKHKDSSFKLRIVKAVEKEEKQSSIVMATVHSTKQSPTSRVGNIPAVKDSVPPMFESIGPWYGHTLRRGDMIYLTLLSKVIMKWGITYCYDPDNDDRDNKMNFYPEIEKKPYAYTLCDYVIKNHPWLAHNDYDSEWLTKLDQRENGWFMPVPNKNCYHAIYLFGFFLGEAYRRSRAWWDYSDFETGKGTMADFMRGYEYCYTIAKDLDIPVAKDERGVTRTIGLQRLYALTGNSTMYRLSSAGNNVYVDITWPDIDNGIITPGTNNDPAAELHDYDFEPQLDGVERTKPDRISPAYNAPLVPRTVQTTLYNIVSAAYNAALNSLRATMILCCFIIRVQATLPVSIRLFLVLLLSIASVRADLIVSGRTYYKGDHTLFMDKVQSEYTCGKIEVFDLESYSIENVATCNYESSGNTKFSQQSDGSYVGQVSIPDIASNGDILYTDVKIIAQITSSEGYHCYVDSVYAPNVYVDDQLTSGGELLWTSTGVQSLAPGNLRVVNHDNPKYASRVLKGSEISSTRIPEDDRIFLISLRRCLLKMAVEEGGEVLGLKRKVIDCLRADETYLFTEHQIRDFVSNLPDKFINMARPSSDNTDTLYVSDITRPGDVGDSYVTDVGEIFYPFPKTEIYVNSKGELFVDRPYLSPDEVLSDLANRSTVLSPGCQSSASSAFSVYHCDNDGYSDCEPAELHTSFSGSYKENISDYSGLRIEWPTLICDTDCVITLKATEGWMKATNIVTGVSQEVGEQTDNWGWCTAGTDNFQLSLEHGAYTLTAIATEGCVVNSDVGITVTPGVSFNYSSLRSSTTVNYIYTTPPLSGYFLGQDGKMNIVSWMVINNLYFYDHDAFCLYYEDDGIIHNDCGLTGEEPCIFDDGTLSIDTTLNEINDSIIKGATLNGTLVCGASSISVHSGNGSQDEQMSATDDVPTNAGTPSSQIIITPYEECNFPIISDACDTWQTVTYGIFWAVVAIVGIILLIVVIKLLLKCYKKHKREKAVKKLTGMTSNDIKEYFKNVDASRINNNQMIENPADTL